MKILRVNMTNKTTAWEPVPQNYLFGLGGRTLTSTIVADEVDTKCDALGPKNKLVFAPGLLTGTVAPCSGRSSAGAKSPLTGGIKESNAGGMSGIKMVRLGIYALIIEGQPKNPDDMSLLIVKSGKAEFVPANEYKGKGNYELIDLLKAKYGEKTAIVCIGPAGEMKMKAANISVSQRDKGMRSHGRGGLGAVMGSKGIKAIVLDDTDGKDPSYANPERFKKVAKRFTEILQQYEVTGVGLPTYGTNLLVDAINEAGGYPTRNFRYGRFKGKDKVNAEAMYNTIKARGGKPTHGCHPGCVIRCSQVYVDKDGKYLTSGFEYETIWAFGAHCEIDELDDIAMLDHLCDDLGLDSIETGVAMGVAMDGGMLEFGDSKKAIKLLDEDVRKGTKNGRLLGDGALATGTALGVKRIPVVKGQSMPAYDPRAIKGMGVTYATTPMGADHTTGYCVAPNVMGIGGNVPALSKDGQVELSRRLQLESTGLDGTGLCLFVAFPAMAIPEGMLCIIEMINAKTGLPLSAWDVGISGMRIATTERLFNKAAGFTEKDDRLPEFMKTEPLPPHNVVFDIPDAELDRTHPYVV